MELSAFMSEQLQAPMALLEAQRQQIQTQRDKCEARLEAQIEALRQQIETQRETYESQIDAQRQQIDAQRQQIEALQSQAQRHSHDANDFRRARVGAFQTRLEELYKAKLLEDDELCAIEDKVADAVGAAHKDDGDDGAWMYVMEMIQLSEGIVSEKMFSRQLRRKFIA
jgi:chromosome segregation ATPase